MNGLAHRRTRIVGRQPAGDRGHRLGAGVRRRERRPARINGGNRAIQDRRIDGCGDANAGRTAPRGEVCLIERIFDNHPVAHKRDSARRCQAAAGNAQQVARIDRQIAFRRADKAADILGRDLR